MGDKLKNINEKDKNNIAEIQDEHKNNIVENVEVSSEEQNNNNNNVLDLDRVGALITEKIKALENSIIENINLNILNTLNKHENIKQEEKQQDDKPKELPKW